MLYFALILKTIDEKFLNKLYIDYYNFTQNQKSGPGGKFFLVESNFFKGEFLGYQHYVIASILMIASNSIKLYSEYIENSKR